MTDRHAGFLVTLDHDIREDDAENLVTAIKMIKGVLDVSPVLADSSPVVHDWARRIMAEPLLPFHLPLPAEDEAR